MLIILVFGVILSSIFPIFKFSILMFKDLSEVFEAFAKVTGINEGLTNRIIFYTLLVGFITTIITFVYNVVKKVVSYLLQRKINSDLHPFFTPSDVRNATNFYISTKYQNVSPSEDEEPGRRYIASAKNEMMSLFLKNIFPFGKNDNKYYLILADSGMGKTTFLINLYIKYKNKFHPFFKLKPYSIKLIPIWHLSAMEYIDKISDPENTILLLDAFDENISAQTHCFKTLRNILLKVSKFRIIVMTCRTQFFPSQMEEPHETGYFTAGEKGEFYFQKLYISVFDDKDIKKYLKNRFPYLWQRKKYLKAKSIANKCPNLIIRPMLLNHIEDILSDDKYYEYSFQIYDALINSWIRREAKKIGIKEKYQTEMRFIRLLKVFSEKLAINFYEKRKIRDGYYIPKEEGFSEGILTLEDYEDLQNVEIDEIDSRSKSLLTRNAAGDYKFSHKSILEFFLAKAIYNKLLPLDNFYFFGMDMVKKFLGEMVFQKLKTLDGSFCYKRKNYSKEDNLSLNNLDIKKVDEISLLIVNDMTAIDPVLFSLFQNLSELVLIDKLNMKEVYKLYSSMHLYFEHLSEQIKQQKLPKKEKQIWSDKLHNLESNNLWALKNHLQSLGLEKTKELSKVLNLNVPNINYAEVEIKLEVGLLSNINEILDELKQSNNFIERVGILQTKLPNCKVLF